MNGMFDLTGKVAIVTGGNGGIGLGMARGLAAHGAAVVVAGRNAEKTAAAVKELQDLGAPASGVAVDVTDEASGSGRWSPLPSSATGGSTSWSTTPASTSASRRTTMSLRGVARRSWTPT